MSEIVCGYCFAFDCLVVSDPLHIHKIKVVDLLTNRMRGLAAHLDMVEVCQVVLHMRNEGAETVHFAFLEPNACDEVVAFYRLLADRRTLPVAAGQVRRHEWTPRHRHRRRMKDIDPDDVQLVVCAFARDGEQLVHVTADVRVSLTDGGRV